MSVCSDVHVIDTLRGGDVYGVALLNDKLYVLRVREFDHDTWFGFDIYFTKNGTWQLEKMMTVAGQDLRDVASSAVHQCLFVCDFSAKSVLKLGLDVEVVKSWSVDEAPVGVSVVPDTDSCRVLITSGESNTLLVLDCESGQCLPFIALPEDVQLPRHAILLSGKELMVSHGEHGENRVCKMRSDGGVLCSFDDVKLPCQMAVDKDGFVFVADCWNERVVLLSPTLEFIREIKDLGDTPRRLCLDHFHRMKLRLYVGLDDKLSVVEL